MRYLIVLLCLVSLPCEAATIKGGFPACLTEDLLTQEIVALNVRDYEAVYWLVNHGCAETKDGLHATVIETRVPGNAHVRVYRGRYAAEVWVPVEAVNQ